MKLTNSDFQSWKAMPMTKKVMEYIEELLGNDTDYLIAQAGLDPQMDRWRAGHIQGFRDVLDYQFGEEDQ